MCVKRDMYNKIHLQAPSLIFMFFNWKSMEHLVDILYFSPQLSDSAPGDWGVVDDDQWCGHTEQQVHPSADQVTAHSWEKIDVSSIYLKGFSILSAGQIL